MSKVIAFTGSGDGWRFDTNGNGKKGDKRFLGIDFAGNEDIAGYLQTTVNETKRVDMRFQSDELNLCEVGGTLDNPSTVSVGIGFQVGNVGDFPYGASIRYGAQRCQDGNGVNQDNINAARMVVTRINPTTWTFEGTEACMETGNPETLPLSKVFSLPFKFTLTAQ